MNKVEEPGLPLPTVPGPGGAGRPGAWLRPARWLWVVAFGLLAAKLIYSLNISWQIFNFAFQVDESESMIVAETMLMSQGLDIFALPGPERFISAPYTPFYYWLNWPALHLLGPSFKPGRLISFMAAAGIAGLIYRMVAAYALACTNQPARLAGWLGALAWSSLGLVAFWGSAVKPDMTALFFSLAGLYLIFKATATPTSPVPPASPRLARFFRPAVSRSGLYLYGAAGLLALAALTKQTALAGGLAGFIWLLLQRPALAGRWGLIYVGLAAGPMLLLNWASAGGFWWHIVTVHQLPWNGQNYWKFMGAFLQTYQLFGLLAAGFGLFWLADMLGGHSASTPAALTIWKRFRSNPGTLVLLYAGAGWGAGLSAGTYGGNHNHLLEFAAAGCILLGCTFVRLNWWRQTAGAGGWQRSAVVLALLLVGWQGAGLLVGEAKIKPAEVPLAAGFEPGQVLLRGLRSQFYQEDWLRLEYRAPAETLKRRWAEIAAFMNNDSGRFIYADNASLLLATTRPIFTTDPFTQTHASFYRRWNQSKFIEMLNRQEFSLVVLRSSIEERLKAGQPAGDIYLSPEMAGAILDHYRLACRDSGYIYVPKNRQDFKGC